MCVRSAEVSVQNLGRVHLFSGVCEVSTSESSVHLTVRCTMYTLPIVPAVHTFRDTCYPRNSQPPPPHPIHHPQTAHPSTTHHPTTPLRRHLTPPVTPHRHMCAERLTYCFDTCIWTDKFYGGNVRMLVLQRLPFRDICLCT